MSHEIISENQVIVSEDLQIKNMAKSISDVSWYELTRQLEYKAKWNGRKPLALDNG